MYFSRLVLNPRSRDARRDMSDPYEMHRTLMRAFPNGNHGGPGRVLWRLDSDRHTGRSAVLVQSDKQPNWEWFQNSSEHYLENLETGGPNLATKEQALQFLSGQILAFRLLANPTVKRDGKRHGYLTEEDQLAWLQRKAKVGGFSILGVRVTPQGTVRCKDSDATQAMSFVAARFDGILRVTDASQLRETIKAGVGTAKSFGFGLLSLARYTS